MGRSPCCSKVGLRRGPWSAMEDSALTHFIQQHGEGQWRSLPKRAGLLRCGKSCRLRWMNYLRPGIKRGNISEDEEDLIVRLHGLLGNRWSLIAGRLPGRTDNEIKNYWNTHLLKKLNSAGIHPVPHRDLPKPQPSKHKQNQKHKEKQNKIALTTAEEKEKEKAKAKEKAKENDHPSQTRVYLPKPIRITAQFSRSSSYDSLASGASCGSEKAVEGVSMEWPPLFEMEDAAYGVYIGDGGEDDFLAGGEYALMPVLSHSESISDDVEMLEKVYDEYLQLL